VTPPGLTALGDKKSFLPMMPLPACLNEAALLFRSAKTGLSATKHWQMAVYDDGVCRNIHILLDSFRGLKLTCDQASKGKAVEVLTTARACALRDDSCALQSSRTLML
jgi:hypothetical protein